MCANNSKQDSISDSQSSHDSYGCHGCHSGGLTSLAVVISKSTFAPHNLAVEEYLTMHTDANECILYLWQNRNTIVVGRNQNVWSECRTEEFHSDGGVIVRRLSGGGAVFHDLGNLNFTFMMRKNHYNIQRQLEVILRALEKCGIKAEKTGRNDITVDGKKISGNAFYRSGDFCYHHGTLLISADREQMSRYLNVSREKMQSKGVSSVKSRVANLTDFVPSLTTASLTEKLREAFAEIYGLPAEPAPLCMQGAGARPVPDMLTGTGKGLFLPEDASAQISRLEDKYASWEWTFGKNVSFDTSIRQRLEWGDVDISFAVDGGAVADCRIYSDAMDQAYIQIVSNSLQGKRFSSETLVSAIKSLEVSEGNEDDTEVDSSFQDTGENLRRKMCEDICGLIEQQNY